MSIQILAQATKPITQRHFYLRCALYTANQPLCAARMIANAAVGIVPSAATWSGWPSMPTSPPTAMRCKGVVIMSHAKDIYIEWLELQISDADWAAYERHLDEKCPVSWQAADQGFHAARCQQETDVYADWMDEQEWQKREC